MGPWRPSAALLFLAAGCRQEVGYTTLTPEISVLPEVVDFGAVVANALAERGVHVALSYARSEAQARAAAS